METVGPMSEFAGGFVVKLSDELLVKFSSGEFGNAGEESFEEVRKCFEAVPGIYWQVGWCNDKACYRQNKFDDVDAGQTNDLQLFCAWFCGWYITDSLHCDSTTVTVDCPTGRPSGVCYAYGHEKYGRASSITCEHYPKRLHVPYYNKAFEHGIDIWSLGQYIKKLDNDGIVAPELNVDGDDVAVLQLKAENEKLEAENVALQEELAALKGKTKEANLASTIMGKYAPTQTGFMSVCSVMVYLVQKQWWAELKVLAKDAHTQKRGVYELVKKHRCLSSGCL